MSLAVPAMIISSALIVIIVCWLNFQLRSQNRKIRQRLEVLDREVEQGKQLRAAAEVNDAIGLSVGSVAPDFELPSLSGSRQKFSQWRGRRVLLIFFDPDCGFCLELAPHLATFSDGGTDGGPMTVVVTAGDVQKNRQWVSEYGIRCPVLLQEQLELARDYHAAGTPTGYLIDEQGLIASELAMGMQALLALADTLNPSVLSEREHTDLDAHDEGNGHRDDRGRLSLAKSRIARDGLTQGTPAPAFHLPRPDNGELSLEQYRGQKVLLVFSDPECGPCNLLAPQLEKLARRTPDIQVIMVSRGEREANRLKVAEQRLTFPVVLQKHWEISRLYAMFATPIAYLIDEHGIIAANVAAGPEPILNLLTSAAILSLLDGQRVAVAETRAEQQETEIPALLE